MQEMIQTQVLSTSKAIEKELEKIPRWKLMMYLHKKGETGAYQIAKDLGWSSGKTHGVIRGLEKSKTVETSTRLVNNRAVKLVKLKE